MSSIPEFLNNPEISDILMLAIPEEVREYPEWEFTLNYADKIIDSLELWKTSKRKKKDLVTIDLTIVFSDFQMKQLFLSFIVKFGADMFESND